MKTLGNVGAPGLALALTLLLILGTKTGKTGRLKPLSWAQAFWCGAFGGAAYQAAGNEPFTSINDIVNGLIRFVFTLVPNLTMPAVALILAIYLLYAQLTTRKVGFVAIILMYAAGGAGGGWAVASTQITAAMQRIAAG